MNKYIALYRHKNSPANDGPSPTPEQMEEAMKPWFAWKEKYDERIIDFGAPVAATLSTENGDQWQKSGNLISGYSIVEAENLEVAKAMFKDHPIFNHPDQAVDINEFMPM